MGLTSIDHVQLAMPAGREPEAVAFYEGVLGLAQQEKPPHLAVRGGCWFGDGAVRIHLGVEADFRPARKAHPALRVEDLDDLVGRLEAGRLRRARGGRPRRVPSALRRRPLRQPHRAARARSAPNPPRGS